MTSELTLATADRLEQLLDRFEAAQQRLAAQQRAMFGVEVEPLAVGDPPPHVAAGELITSAWGNATVDALTEQAVLAQGGGVLTRTRLFIQARESIVSTNAGGDASVLFLTAFATAPIVVASPGDPTSAAGAWWPSIWRGPTTTKFDFRAFRHDGTVLGSAAVNVQYIAIGTRTTA